MGGSRIPDPVKLLTAVISAGAVVAISIAASAADLDGQLGFKAVHWTAGDESGLFGSGERMKDEWTMWLLAGLFVLVLAETVLAWFCGRAW